MTEVYLALLTPASVGRNLISRGLHKIFVALQNSNDLILLVASSGPFSLIGTTVFDTGVFDRIHVSQSDRQYTLQRHPELYRYVPFLIAEGAPAFDEMGIFRVPVETGIDALSHWELHISAPGGIAPSPLTPVTSQVVTYKLPQRFILPATTGTSTTTALQLEHSQVEAAWHAQSTNLIILATALGILTLILCLMQKLSRRPTLYRVTRTLFLMFTLIWLGLIAGAQLSAINPIVWIQTLVTGKGADLFLSDPLLVVLTVYIIVSFLAWGRGIFCGWLCPFGALQELLSQLSRYAKLPQIKLSHVRHQKLWPIKYVVLTVLVASAIHSPATLSMAAEVEPFKTAISLKFDRTWPFVLYVTILLVAGLFIERAFCRFLCPLGAIMAIGGKLRLRNPLKRRTECGSPCQLCRRRCPIQAISPSGQINMDECFYCLDCQVIYHDAYTCPPLINKRKRAVKPVTGPATRPIVSTTRL